MLKSRSRIPPGGFQFFQPQTGWAVPPDVTMIGFDAAVDAIQQHRIANHKRFPALATDKPSIEAELDEYTCIRLAQSGEWCMQKRGSAPPKWFGLPRFQRPAASGEVAAGASKPAKQPSFIRNTIAGIGLYLDWFGDRKPVDLMLAEHRSSICVQCPKHVRGSIAQRFNAAAAKEIMSVFSILSDLELRTSRDDQLAICDACDCPMKAKVWSPIEIIRKHLRPEAKAALWERCWIREESHEP